jgi:hypothetical protein
MVAMNGNGYKLLGYVVWQGGKWYLRRRLPSARTTAVAAVATLSVLAAAVFVARRHRGLTASRAGAAGGAVRLSA